MAKREVVMMTDDLDGSTAETTVLFGIEGSQYEIDLSQSNADELGSVLAPYIGAARRTGGGAASGSRSRSTSASNVGDVRAWAEAQGIKINARGRIPADIQQQYDAAH